MIFTLYPGWVTVVDVLAWFCISLGVGYYFHVRPAVHFEREDWLTRERGWEKSGQLYRQTFHIMKWKGFLPDGSRLSKRGFRKKHLSERSTEYFQTFILESRRAEWTHFVALWFVPVFLIWNTGLDELFVGVYAVMFNVPCMMAQRYNRMRFRRILQRRNETYDG